MKARATASRHERVLRYPNGEERRIIYPVDISVDDEFDNSLAWDVVGLSSTRPAKGRRATASPSAAAIDRASVGSAHDPEVAARPCSSQLTRARFLPRNHRRAQ